MHAVEASRSPQTIALEPSRRRLHREGPSIMIALAGSHHFQKWRKWQTPQSAPMPPKLAQNSLNHRPGSW